MREEEEGDGGAAEEEFFGYGALGFVLVVWKEVMGDVGGRGETNGDVIPIPNPSTNTLLQPPQPHPIPPLPICDPALKQRALEQDGA